MDAQIAAILAVDGIASGAIYVLIAIGLVLVFLVTRVLYVPFGDIAAFTVLTLAALESKQVPGTVWLVGVLAVVATAIETVSLLHARHSARIPRAIIFYLLIPLIPAVCAWFAAPLGLGMLARIVLSILLILPIAPLLDRIVFRPIADASVLLLLIVALALHFSLAGFGLLFFGPRGCAPRLWRTCVLNLLASSFHYRPCSWLAPRSCSAGCCFCSLNSPSPGRRCAQPRSIARAHA